MNLLIDTHVIAWLVLDDRRLSSAFRAQLEREDTRLFVSVITAWEYAELAARHRLPEIARYEILAAELRLEELGIPVGLWRFVSALPSLHLDPVDRILIGHAIEADMVW